MSKKRIAIVGSNNAACLTALTLYKIGDRDIDLDIYYEEEEFLSPFAESVSYQTAQTLQHALKFDWYKNQIGATPNFGSLYWDWGVKNKEIFCSSEAGNVRMNYAPKSLFERIKETKMIRLHEQKFVSLEKEIDADYIVDCRPHALKSRDFDKYETLESPVDRVIIGNKDEVSNHVEICAVSDGWYSKIPNGENTTYIFAFNSDFLSEEDAPKRFTELTDIEKMHCTEVENYLAKNIWQNDRTVLNGLALSSYDPLDGSINDFYMRVANHFWDYVSRSHIEEHTKEFANNFVKCDMMQVFNYTLWHYEKGSQFDTPFWKNAMKIVERGMNDICLFRNIEASKLHSYNTFSNWDPQYYMQWSQLDFKKWSEFN